MLLIFTTQIGKCPDDYKQWMTTMYSQFGNKWANLHMGPMWTVATVEQECTHKPVPHRSTDPMDVS